MKLFKALIVLLAALVFFSATPAFGQSPPSDLSIPIDTIEFGPGVHPLTTVSTPTNLLGQTCEVLVVNRNQASVHDNNDLLIESATAVVARDVESLANLVVAAESRITLGDSITVSVDIGADPAVFSAGLDVGFTCSAATTTTTTTVAAVASTTTTAAPTTTTTTTAAVEPTTTTAVSAPEGCGAGTLACTGPSSKTVAIALLGLFSFGAGLAAVVAARKHSRVLRDSYGRKHL